METNANYQELKETTKGVVQLITSDNLYYGLALLVGWIVLVKIVDLIFKPMRKRGSMLAAFLSGCIKVFLTFTIGMRICSLIPGLKDFTSQIVLSSSLIVVVLGFVFQEGLSNIVHGFILSVFRPFGIGDRISVMVDGETITGYVKEITPRHTVIQNVINSSHAIIPNAKMDTSLVTNSYYDKSSLSTSFLDVEITYESNLEKAILILEDAVMEHPLVRKAREAKKIKEPVAVQVRELASDGIALRAVVATLTVEENFRACSDIRRNLVHIFETEPDLDFAYPHMHLVGGSPATAAVIRGQAPRQAGHGQISQQ